MKTTTFLCLLILSRVTSFGQTLFFDDLNSAIWTSSGEVTESTLGSEKSRELYKRNPNYEIFIYPFLYAHEDLIPEYKADFGDRVINKVDYIVRLNDYHLSSIDDI